MKNGLADSPEVFAKRAGETIITPHPGELARLTGANAKTITVVVTEFSSQFGVDFGLMATGGVIGSKRR